MSKLNLPSVQQPLVEPDGTPTRTTQQLLDAMVKRINKAASLDTGTATAADIINALNGE